MINFARSALMFALRAIGHTYAPGSYRIVSALAPKHLESKEFRIRALGIKNYTGDLSDNVDWHIFYFGAYAVSELVFLRDCAKLLASPQRRISFFDIGANVGQHSLYMSSFVDEVSSFEPSQRIVAQLRQNIASNAIENIRVYNFGLGDGEAVAELGAGFSGNSGSRSLLWSRTGEHTETVIIRQGDSFISKSNDLTINLCKVDVEGYESRVLSGLRETLIRDRPIILMELIGADEKGGFQTEKSFRESLYPDHRLFP